MQQERSSLLRNSLVESNLGVQALRNGPNAMRLEAGAGGLNSSQVCAPAPSPSHPVRLLQFTADMHLARIREPLLRRAGFDVENLLYQEVHDASRMNGALAALFCQTVKQAEALRLFYLLQTVSEHAKTIRLCRQPGHEADVYSRVLESPVPPALLVHETMMLWESVWPGGKPSA